MQSKDLLKTYKADLHIHTVLSPCGSLEMGPVNIVNEARKKGLNVIGITDHNATQHGPLVQKLTEKVGIYRKSWNLCNDGYRSYNCGGGTLPGFF